MPFQKTIFALLICLVVCSTSQGQSDSREEFNPIFEKAKSIGLHGRWYVTSSEKDGVFSSAQIGQEVSDVITILPEHEAELYQPIT